MKPDFALVIPRDEQGVWLVEQYRYPVRRRAWEFPQGSWGTSTSGTRAELAAAQLDGARVAAYGLLLLHESSR